MKESHLRLLGSAGRSAFELFPRGSGAHRWSCTITGTVLDRVPLLVGICERKWNGAPCRIEAPASMQLALRDPLVFALCATHSHRRLLLYERSPVAAEATGREKDESESGESRTHDVRSRGNGLKRPGLSLLR